MTYMIKTWLPMNYVSIMTSLNGHISLITGPLRGEFTGHRWISLTKASDSELWCVSLIYAWTNGDENHRDAGDLRRHGPHHGVTAKLSHSHVCSTGFSFYICTLLPTSAEAIFIRLMASKMLVHFYWFATEWNTHGIARFKYLRSKSWIQIDNLKQWVYITS